MMKMMATHSEVENTHSMEVSSELAEDLICNKHQPSTQVLSSNIIPHKDPHVAKHQHPHKRRQCNSKPAAWSQPVVSLWRDHIDAPDQEQEGKHVFNCLGEAIVVAHQLGKWHRPIECFEHHKHLLCQLVCLLLVLSLICRHALFWCDQVTQFSTPLTLSQQTAQTAQVSNQTHERMQTPCISINHILAHNHGIEM